jgi:hypothetical protein
VRRFLTLAWSVAGLGSNIFVLFWLLSAGRFEDLAAGSRMREPARAQDSGGPPNRCRKLGARRWF